MDTATTLTWVFAAVGFVAAILQIIQAVPWMKRGIRSLVAIVRGYQPGALSANRIYFSTGRWRYLLTHETIPIVTAGILLNAVGLALASRVPSIIYFDMVGTAIVAFLLGPWWGSVAAVLSSAFVNWLIHETGERNTIVFPWIVVNVAGAFFWGTLARTRWFSSYLKSDAPPFSLHVTFLLVAGVLGALVMAVPGAYVQLFLDLSQDSNALNPNVAQAINSLYVTILEYVGASSDDPSSVRTDIVLVLVNAIRYIPDKTLAAALGLLFVRYGLPIYEDVLIHESPRNRLVGATWFSPAVFGCVYVLPMLVLCRNTGDKHAFLVLWAWPFVTAGIVAAWLATWRLNKIQLRSDVRNRIRAYRMVHRCPEMRNPNRFQYGLVVPTLVCSLVYAVTLPIFIGITNEYARVVANFFVIVYGFVFIIYVVRLSSAQNTVAAARWNSD